MHDFSPRMALIAAVAAGGLLVVAWRVVVAPLHVRLASASVQETTLLGQISGLEALRLPDQRVLDQELHRVTERGERLREAGKAPDGNLIQERVRSLAGSHRVRIDRLERRGRVGSTEGRGAAYALRDALGYSISAQGTYTDMADFIESVRTGLGLTRISGLRLTPVETSQGRSVSAVIETTHMRLVAPQAKPSATVRKEVRR